MKYIHKYTSFLNYSSIIRKTYPDISLITESNNFVILNHYYNQYEHKCHQYKHKYLTFEILTAGTIIWKMIGSNAAKTIEYSLNDGSWTSITSTSSGISISVSQGDIIKFRGSNTAYAKDKKNYSAFYEGTATYNAYGNIMSLIYGDNFEKQKKLTAAWALSNLFNHSNIISAENLLMPATILTNDCYRATFANSPLLTIAPDLPAITLAEECYYYMFDNCFSLIKAPDLLAPILVSKCYFGMFHVCTSLNYIKCLATNISASSCTSDWIGNSEGTVAETGTFIKDPNMTNWTTTGFNGIPSGWTVIDYIELVNPVITCFGDVVEITCQTQNADIYYDLNESGTFTKYTAPIEINGNTIIDAYSELNGQTSNIISQTCTYVYESKLAASNKSIGTWTYNNQTIQTPYSVNAIDGHSSNYSKGTFNFETTIILKRVQPTYLWFQHADQSAEIFVDNVSVIKHWGGYNAFFVDITNYIHTGTNNIKVALKNNEGNNLAPASGDFNFNATLGNVKLFTSPVLPAMIYGYDGFHITATNVSSASATLTIKTSVPVGATVVCKIDDDDSNYHFYEEKPSTGSEMSFITTITNPTLWNGKINPHLYDVTLEIYKNGDLYHRFERGYGIRYYSYVYNYTLPNNETYTGFLLNGSPYLLRGVCMHDDLEGKANALNDNDYTQEFAMIQEVGCNFIRLAHYPHPKEVYDWCDRLGIIVQTEVPMVNILKSDMPETYYTHLEGQYIDMVNQHYNHPCIMFWGLGNEFNAQMNDASFACTKLEHYRDVIKTYDTERMVGCVLNASSSNPRSTVGGADLDWYGCNIYVGWYSNQSSNDPTSQINTRLNNVTNRPIAYSEYGGGGTQHCHSETPLTTTTRGNNPRHDIEYQMWLHEGHIAAIKNFPQLLFTSEWQFFDIAVSSRNEGYTVCLDGVTTSIDDNLRRLNDKGLVERDHTTKKDTFYLYKAWWNQTDKFVYICGKDYQKIDNRVIKCYTNDGDSLSLYVNNTFIETVTVTNNIASFTARTYSPEDIIKVQGATTNDIFTIDVEDAS